MTFGRHLMSLSCFSDDLVGLGSETLVQTPVSGQYGVYFSLHNLRCACFTSLSLPDIFGEAIVQNLAYCDLGIVVMPQFI